jgi:hypothetical protein
LIRVYDGNPSAGGTVIQDFWAGGNMVTSFWTGIYRSIDTDVMANNRPIMNLHCAVPEFVLPEGQYWVEWSAAGTLASGPWMPPVTILGETTTGDALQYTGAWAPFVDGGTGTGQGATFDVLGEIMFEGDVDVTFNVDMNTAIMLGDFVPGTDVVYIAGDPWGWAEPGTYTPTSLELTDGDGDGVYTNTFMIAAGDIAYKYFKNAGWDGGEWAGDPNRTYTVTAPVVLNDVWANEYLVTFSVTDGTNAVEGAEIDIESGTETGMTDVDGMAYFGIVDGTYAFTVTMAGYQVFNGSFTVDAANEDVDVVLTVGVNALSSQINVYPNPSNGVFNINVGSSMNLEVFDITGKIINTQVVNGATQMKLDAAGIYFLKFSNPEGSYTMKVVVK